MDDSSLLKKLCEFSIGPVIGALISLISTPLFTYFISPEEYGRSSMFSIAITVLQLVVFLGMDQAYAKRYYESGDHSKLFINAVFPSAILILLLEIVLYVIRKQVSVWLFDCGDEVACVYAIMAILPFLAVERFFLLSIRMEQKGLLLSGMTLLLKCLILVCTVVLMLAYEKSFRTIVWGSVIAQILFSIVLITVQRNAVHMDFRNIDLSDIKSLLRFALPIVPTTVIGWVLSGMDKVMLRTMSDYSSLGLYTVAAKIAATLSILQSCFTSFWVPVAHQWKKENADCSKFTKAGRIVTCVMSVVFIGVLLFKDVIFLLFKAEYAEAAVIIPFLLFIPIMYTISEVTVMGIYFKEKTGWTVLVSIISAGINLILNFLLIPLWNGAGAAIATGVSYIAFFWCRTLFSRRLWYKFPLRDYIFITVLLIFIAGINTAFNGWSVYATNILSLVLLAVYFIKDIRALFDTGMDFLKERSRKQAK